MFPTPLRIAAIVLGLAATGHAQIQLPATIDDTTFGPLLSGNVYIADVQVTVPPGATQTIQPGAIVKFAPNRAFVVGGTLNALGTPAQPILFTSIKDDAGIVTDAGAPAPGDWRAISFNSGAGASQLSHFVVRYAGQFVNAAMSLATGADIVMDHVTIELSGSAGLDGGANSTVASGGAPTATSCRFDNNVGRSVFGLQIGAIPGFSGCTANGNQGGDAMKVRNGTTAGSFAITLDNLLGGQLVMGDDLVVSSGDTLTLAAGLLFKFDVNFLGLKTGVTANGTLLVPGTETARVTMTSLQDDQVGGDTGADGPSTGAPGDWRGLLFNSPSAASVLDFVTVRFAGAFSTAAIRLSFADITLRDSAVERSQNDGLDPSNSAPIVERCRFDDNLGDAISQHGWSALHGMLDNTASGNGGVNYSQVKGGSITSGFTRVDPWKALNGDGVIVVTNQTMIFAPAILTLSAGVIVKFTDVGGFSAAGGLFCNGFGFAKVILTSFEDDEFGGDTNGDGAATSPQPGDWGHVTYGGGATGAQMNHVYLRYGGSTGQGVLMNAAAVSIDSVRVDFSAGNGIVINTNGGGMRNLVAFRNQGHGIVHNQGPVGMLFATSTENGGAGIIAASGSTLGANSCISWNNTGGNYVNYPVGNLKFCNGIGSADENDGNINVDPLFVDPANGDLTLGFFSPCVMRADPFKAQLTGEDHLGNSRSADDNFSGFAQPDMGAYELPVYRMEVDGFARLGKSFKLRVEGAAILGNPPGTGLYFLGTGFNGIGIFTPHYGYLLVAGGGTVQFLFTFPTSTDLTLQVPDDPILLDAPVGIQPLVQPLGNPNVGNWTNAYLGTIRA